MELEVLCARAQFQPRTIAVTIINGAKDSRSGSAASINRHYSRYNATDTRMSFHKQVPEYLLLLQPHLLLWAMKRKWRRSWSPRPHSVHLWVVNIQEGDGLLLHEHIIQNGSQELDPLLDPFIVRGPVPSQWRASGPSWFSPADHLRLLQLRDQLF